MTYRDIRVSTSSQSVIMEVDIVVNDGTNTIVEVKNIRLLYNLANMSNVSWGSPNYWNGGAYATITVTYKQGGTVKSDVVYCYP